MTARSSEREKASSIVATTNKKTFFSSCAVPAIPLEKDVKTKENEATVTQLVSLFMHRHTKKKIPECINCKNIAQEMKMVAFRNRLAYFLVSAASS